MRAGIRKSRQAVVGTSLYRDDNYFSSGRFYPVGVHDDLRSLRGIWYEEL